MVCVGVVEAAGSNPVTQTKQKRPFFKRSFFVFIVHFHFFTDEKAMPLSLIYEQLSVKFSCIV